jgi:hypothetical protein
MSRMKRAVDKQTTTWIALSILVLVAILGSMWGIKEYFTATASASPSNERKCNSDAECPRYFNCKESKCVDTRPKL